MTFKLAVFGNPIEHSLSPLIHQHFASQYGQDITYERILVEHTFAQKADEFFAGGGFGCNITVPCKLNALDYATELTPRAKIAQAVNTLKFTGFVNQKPQFLGDNTDGAGFFQDLKRLNCPLKGSNILILGAGGATRGILPNLMDYRTKVKSITVANRTTAKIRKIFENLQEQVDTGAFLELKACNYESLEPDMHFDVIINATSLSMNNELPKIPPELYSHAQFVYDLYYTKDGSTIFTNKARSLNVEHCYDGLGMLVGQAAQSYELWTGVLPDTENTINYIRSVLQQQ